MQLTVDAVSDIKTGQYGVSSKIKAGNDYFWANEDASQYIGKTLEVEITEKSSAKGNKYKIAKILGVAKEQQAPAAATNGAASWDEWESFIRTMYKLVQELEPDGYGGPISNGDESPQLIIVDRSQARVALAQSFIVAFRDSRILRVDDESVPF